MPAAAASHPSVSEELFQALKKHILKERQKKKEEQEATAEVARQRKERELQQKQDVMTLEENREQISLLEQTLSKLKEEKHQLFLQLKKVLNEEDIRRRQQCLRQQESTANQVVDVYGNLYSTGVPQLPGHTIQLVMPSYPPLENRNSVYKTAPSHSLLQTSSLKRPRSPSPPPQQYHQNYKPNSAMSQNSQQLRVVSYQNPKPSNYYYHHSSGQPTYVYPNQNFGPSSSRNDHNNQPPAKQMNHMPMSRVPITQSYNVNHHSTEYVSHREEKYYSVVRPATHVPLHGGAIPIQQPAQGTKTGGITSGYPIRPPNSAPPQPPPHLPPGSKWYIS